MEIVSGIYKITNVTNGKFYIGSSVDIRRRWSTHKSKLNNKTHQNPYLENAWAKIGESFFIFEVLEEVKKDRIVEREQYWLDELKPYRREIGYNCATVAGSNWLGRNHTEETKAKMSESQKKRPKRKLSQEHIENIRKASASRVHTEETKEKMSRDRIGTKFSEEHRKKLSISLMGNSNSKGYRMTNEQKCKITGSKNSQAKLKEDDVVIIKRMLREGKRIKEISTLFNVSKSCIKQIKGGHSWKNVI